MLAPFDLYDAHGFLILAFRRLAMLPPALISYTINTLLLCSCPPCVFPVRGVIERSFLAFLFSGVFEHVNPFSKRAGNCAQMACRGCFQIGRASCRERCKICGERLS